MGVVSNISVLGTPLVSVVMSVYNEERWLPRSIESVLSQAYTNFEFIIVNNGSTDNSQSVLEYYASRDSRILILGCPGVGLQKALNHGLKHVSGEYIVRMDADDMCLPERFARQVDFLNEHQEIALVA
jgi:glycosyltransferase involved in cell wall biosynthesis